MNHRILGGGNPAGRRSIDREVDPDPPGVQTGLVPRRGAGHDAVKVVRIPLGARQAVPPSPRAGVVIRPGRRVAVEGPDDRLPRHRHLVRRPVREIDQLLGMTGHEVRGAADVAGIRAGRGIPVRQGGGHQRVGNVPGQSPRADRLELSVPAGHRKPDLDLDIGIGGRPRRETDAAKRWQMLERLPPRRRIAARSAGGRERAGRHHLRGRDGRAGEWELGEILTADSRLGGCRTQKHCRQKNCCECARSVMHGSPGSVSTPDDVHPSPRHS